MEQPNYWTMFMSIMHRPGLYGLQDAMDIDVFLRGYCIGADATQLRDFLSDFTDYLKKEDPYYAESTCGWSNIIKAYSWERGGSIQLLKSKFGQMLLDQGHWKDEHYEAFTSKEPLSLDVLKALPAPAAASL